MRRAREVQLPVYLAGPPPPGMRVIGALRASARGEGAHLDTLLVELDRRAVAMGGEAIAVRAIRVGGEATVTAVPRPCPGDLPMSATPLQPCTEALTGVELEMTIEADALRGAGPPGWPTPWSADGGAADAE